MTSDIRYIGNDGTFRIDNPENISYLYFPIAGEDGLKSSITPTLGGDAKIDQTSFLLEPVSAENLHNNRSTRNFWVRFRDENGTGIWSLTGASAEAENDRFTSAQDPSTLTAGLMWQKLERTSRHYGLKSEITSFVPVHENCEVHIVTLTNTAAVPRTVTLITGIPLYGRSADNIRDHRNVTSLLHRVRTLDNGIVLKPTMSFDERGHKRNLLSYYVFGAGENAQPCGFYPTVDLYLGEGGTFTHPQAVYEDIPAYPAGGDFEGREAVGGIRFRDVTLAPGESTSFVVIAGIQNTGEKDGAREENGELVIEDGKDVDHREADQLLEEIASRYDTKEKAEASLEEVKAYWQDMVNVHYRTGDPDQDNYLRWVSFQPILRRIYGCSFLPHHDYGRGGRGWRDLWQDCLSLLIMNPGDVRHMLVCNFGGVRIDGTNATIIGDGEGQFIADRNGIARVWMDHGVWPFMTTKFYIDQTGDLDLLLEKAPYFKDLLSFRGKGRDTKWDAGQGTRLRDASGNVYEGTVLEHLLVESLTSILETGEHGIIRMRDADWNDALDMASERGESVAFTCAYCGNLHDLADLLDALAAKGVQNFTVFSELGNLLQEEEDPKKEPQLLEQYERLVEHTISGSTITLDTSETAGILRRKADHMMNRIRTQEWISDGEGHSWFNSYYDNHGRQVEGRKPGEVRMMLTGQVFAIMSGTASDEQTAEIARSADHYLFDESVAGYRLNNEFHEVKMDFGRAFGFAYGEKENGAVFSHMTVMYANALYRRDFVREGNKALKTLIRHAMNFPVSRIYPGIPEYFSADGRGMYHYLTGSASWMMMTVVTQQYGVRGELGDLRLSPKFLPEEFENGDAKEIFLSFGGKKLHVVIRKEKGTGTVSRVRLDGTDAGRIDEKGGLIEKSVIDALDEKEHLIEVDLV